MRRAERRAASKWNRQCTTQYSLMIWMSALKKSDYLGLLLFGTPGLWMVAFPGSFIRFYTWFHRGTVRLPEGRVIRLMGVLWIVLVVSVVVVGRKS